MAILFMATEMFLNLIRPSLVSRFWNKFIVNEHTLVDMPRDFDYLLMGDSIQKTGIEVTLVGDDILNLGLPGSKPASLYILFKRYIEKHNPPKAVFLFLDPQEPHESMKLTLKYFVKWPEFISLWKYLTWDERAHFMLRYWVSLDERLVTDPLGQFYLKPNRVFQEELRQNHGYMPLPNQDLTIKDDYFVTSGMRPEKSVSTTKRDFIYIDKFITLARAHHVKIILLGNILPKELYDIAEKTGYNLQWLAFLDILKGRYPDVERVKEPILFLEKKYFADMSHVNKNGRVIYTAYFKNQVYIPFTRLLNSGGEGKGVSK